MLHEFFTDRRAALAGVRTGAVPAAPEDSTDSEADDQPETQPAVETTETLNQRLGILAHELRDLIHTTTLAVTALKAADIGFAGATGAVLDRSLVGLRTLADRSLASVRASAGLPVTLQRIGIAGFIAEVRASADLEAQSQGCRFIVAGIDPALEVDGDRDMLLLAAGNLLRNAFKFTHSGSEVTLNVYATSDRVLIDIKDHCGGLPPGAVETLFQPYRHNGVDPPGPGLGLFIARRCIEANHGILRMRDVPGSGCGVTMDLPRRLHP